MPLENLESLYQAPEKKDSSKIGYFIIIGTIIILFIIVFILKDHIKTAKFMPVNDQAGKNNNEENPIYFTDEHGSPIYTGTCTIQGGFTCEGYKLTPSSIEIKIKSYGPPAYKKIKHFEVKSLRLVEPCSSNMNVELQEVKFQKDYPIRNLVLENCKFKPDSVGNVTYYTGEIKYFDGDYNQELTAHLFLVGKIQSK